MITNMVQSEQRGGYRESRAEDLHPEHTKIFQTVKEFCAFSGLSCKAIREGCKSGKIPHIRIGEGSNARFLVDVPVYLEQLHEESRKRGNVNG